MPFYYPIHLDLADRLCLVVGGGPVAERRVMGLLEAHAHIRVVTLKATSTLTRLGAESKIEIILSGYSSEYLEGVSLAFVATENEEINARIAADAIPRNVWVNRADAFEAGDFIVPATVRRGDLCISISTGGNQPVLTAQLAAEFEARFGADYGDYVALLGRMRTEIKSRTASTQRRRAAMQTLLDAEEPLRSQLAAGDVAAAIRTAQRLIAPLFTSGEEDDNAAETH